MRFRTFLWLAGATISRAGIAYAPRDDPAFDGLVARVQPLGASITSGEKSSDGNGYRLKLLNMVDPPADWTYIGSLVAGTMANNQNEGHSGFVIEQVAKASTASSGQRPNVVLIYAGTNDMAYPVDPDNAPARMGALIDMVSCNNPDALLLVGNLFTDANSTIDARIQKYNKALPGVIADKAGSGVKVALLDFYSALGTSDLADGRHPNDGGYQKMANVWFSGLKANVGSISPPVELTDQSKALGVACAYKAPPSPTSSTTSSTTTSSTTTSSTTTSSTTSSTTTTTTSRTTSPTTTTTPANAISRITTTFRTTTKFVTAQRTSTKTITATRTLAILSSTVTSVGQGKTITTVRKSTVTIPYITVKSYYTYINGWHLRYTTSTILSKRGLTAPTPAP